MKIQRLLAVPLLAVLGLAALATPALAATTVTVNNAAGAGCSDSSTGIAPAAPLCTVIAAATKATSGQTVAVKAGSYAGGAVVANSGTTFMADPGVTLTGGTNGIKIPKSSVTVSGFAITATTSYGLYVAGTSAAPLTAVTLSNNTVSYAGQPASGQAADGIRLTYVSNATVSGNQTHHNSWHGINLFTGATNNSVSGNQSWLNANQYQRSANGINVVASGNTIKGNSAHDNEDSGINLASGGNNALVVNNLAYGNGDHGIDNLNVSGGRVVNNTVYRNCTTGINVEGTSGGYQVRDNIAADNAVFIINPTPMTGWTNDCNRRHGNIGVWDGAQTTSSANNNLVWNSVAGTLYAWAGTSYTSLTTLRSATGQELAGAQGDPLWANRSAGDFHLGPGSPAIGLADPAVSGHQTTDYYGTAWTVTSSKTDAGAVNH